MSSFLSKSKREAGLISKELAKYTERSSKITHLKNLKSLTNSSTNFQSLSLLFDELSQASGNDSGTKIGVSQLVGPKKIFV